MTYDNPTINPPTAHKIIYMDCGLNQIEALLIFEILLYSILEHEHTIFFVLTKKLIQKLITHHWIPQTHSMAKLSINKCINVYIYIYIYIYKQGNNLDVDYPS